MQHDMEEEAHMPFNSWLSISNSMQSDIEEESHNPLESYCFQLESQWAITLIDLKPQVCTIQIDTMIRACSLLVSLTDCMSKTVYGTITQIDHKT
jgi:hypothetical protein